jgi:hypothetical protein
MGQQTFYLRANSCPIGKIMELWLQVASVFQNGIRKNYRCHQYRTVAIDYKGIDNTNNRLTFHVWIVAKLGIAYFF